MSRNQVLRSTEIRSALLLVVWLLQLGIAFGQKYTLRTFTTEDGLPHNNVREILVDKSGYLWLATWDGISRFDGYEFRNFFHIPGDSASLPFFSISRIVLDGSNYLWVQGDNGAIARFDRRIEKFSTLTSINGYQIKPTCNLCNDEKGNIWIICDSTIFRYSSASASFSKYKVIFASGKPGLISKLNTGNIYYLTTQDEKTIWLASPTILKLEINDETGTITVSEQYAIKLKPKPLNRVIKNFDHTNWFSLFFDARGRKWVRSNTGLFLINEGEQYIPQFNGRIPVEDFKGSGFITWGDTDGGMNILIPEKTKILKVPREVVQYLKFTCALGKDMIWFSNTSFTGNSLGLTRFLVTPDFFKKYTDLTRKDDIPAVFSITTDKEKNVWLGIRGRDYITVLTPDGRLEKKYTPVFGIPGFYGPIRSLKKTETGIWVGYFSRLLLFYDYRSGSFTRFDPGPYDYRALEVRKDGKLYIGNSEIVLYDPVSAAKTVLYDSIPAGGNFRFRIDSNGTLWSGTPYGVFLSYNPSEDKVNVYRTVNKRNNIEDVCPGDNGDIWLAVLGGGLIKYNITSGKSKVYTTSDGLPNNTVYSVLKDKSGNIWFSTDNGISRLNPSTGVIKTFGIAEGLDIVEFNSGASYIDDDGRFFFGGMGGAVSFYPDSLDVLQSANDGEKLILTSLTVSGKSKILYKTLNRSDTILLEKGEDNFHLTFATSDFAISERTNYRYQLIGHDKEWIRTNHANRNINYSNLKPGIYRLNIEASDRDGEWRIHKSIMLNLQPHIYQTVIFRFGVIALILLLFLSMVIMYIRQLNQKAIQIQDELRLQSLRGQMNPHFIFNSLNSINYFISNNDKVSANRYIADFARLIRSILSNMGNDYVRFKGEIESLKDYLEIEHLRFGDKFDYLIEHTGIENPEQLEVFPGLIQPFVENAIWHGVRALEKRKGYITIRLASSGPQKITCTIDDDGIGRKLSSELRRNYDGHISKGISLVRERLNIVSKLRGIEYKLEIMDLSPAKREAGTRVIIDIPSRAGI